MVYRDPADMNDEDLVAMYDIAMSGDAPLGYGHALIVEMIERGLIHAD